MPGSSRIPQAPRSFRFSLRTLLTWILALSVLLAAGRWFYVRTWLQAQVVAKLQAFEAKPEYSGRYSPSTRGGPSHHDGASGGVVVGVKVPVPFRSEKDAAEVNRLLAQLPYLVDVCAYGNHRLNHIWPPATRRVLADRQFAAAIRGLDLGGVVIETPLTGGETARVIRERATIGNVIFSGHVVPPPAELATISQAPHIKRLSFSHTLLTPEHLNVLASARQLENLFIQGEFPHDQLTPLGQLPQCELKLRVRDISDHDLQHHVATLPNLTWLSLCLESPSADALAALCQARRRRRLGLQDAVVDDNAVAPLADLPAIEGLNLGGTEVTELGLVPLARCKSLQHLDIPGSLDEARVQAALPGVNVSPFNSPNTAAHEIRKADVLATRAAAAKAEISEPAPSAAEAGTPAD
jgi:hypothetical protein